jgi:hypothetical protein
MTTYCFGVYTYSLLILIGIDNNTSIIYYYLQFLQKEITFKYTHLEVKKRTVKNLLAGRILYSPLFYGRGDCVPFDVDRL